jgi:hypothetical protein
MSKKIILIISFLVFISNVKSQDVYIEYKLEKNYITKKYEVNGELNIDSINKNELFDKTFYWIKNIKYTSDGYKWINSFDDNILIIKQYFKPENNLLGYTGLRIRFVLTFQFYDNKIKFNYSNFYYYSLSDGNKVFFESGLNENDKKAKDKIINDVEVYTNTLINELEKYIKIVY